METHLREIREQQKESWNKFSSGWKKWDEFTMDWLKPMGEQIIHYLNLKNTDTVLDVAAGTGEPGLTIATIVREGKVVITDLAESMLEVAHENAKRKGVTNYETVVCDVCELPFDDEVFDAVSCRLGFMFFPDMLMAAKEMVRVLKPGGKLATSVWSMPEKNFWINATMSTVNRNMQLPPPKPGGPGMIRCAAPGVLAGLFRQAGLRDVSEMEITGKLNCGSIDTYWNFMNEVVAPVVSVMNKADDAMKEKIRREVYELVDKEYPDKSAALGYAALIVCGEK
jgi:ubiquinone/menaquinone biosynthesis C-methylase UbiE